MRSQGKIVSLLYFIPFFIIPIIAFHRRHPLGHPTLPAVPLFIVYVQRRVYRVLTETGITVEDALIIIIKGPDKQLSIVCQTIHLKIL